MINHNTLIVTFIVIIVGVQIAVFAYAIIKIRAYKIMFPQRGGFKVNKLLLQTDMLAVLTPDEVIRSQSIHTESTSAVEAEAFHIDGDDNPEDEEHILKILYHDDFDEENEEEESR